jgi:hypothetical protein
VQHFPFGSIFVWERDPEANPSASTAHVAAQPISRPQTDSATGMAAPWTKPISRMPPTTYAPTPRTTMPLRPANGETISKTTSQGVTNSTALITEARGTAAANISLTKAPWAK